jgi:hypothetical protein
VKILETGKVLCIPAESFLSLDSPPSPELRKLHLGSVVRRRNLSSPEIGSDLIARRTRSLYSKFRDSHSLVGGLSILMLNSDFGEVLLALHTAYNKQQPTNPSSSKVLNSSI